MAIEAVTFDLDDTLWCGKTTLKNATHDFHAYLDAHYPVVAQAFPPQKFQEVFLQYRAEHPEVAHDYTVLRKNTLKQCAQEAGLAPNEVEACVTSSFEAFVRSRSQPILFDGVLDTLKQLTEPPLQLKIGIITNGNCNLSYLPSLLELFPIEHILSAESAGVAKPDPAIFDAAIEALQSNPENIVHVGDDYECDILGAKKAGYKTVWVNPKYDPKEREVILSTHEAADAIVKDVTELIQVIHSWKSTEA